MLFSILSNTNQELRREFGLSVDESMIQLSKELGRHYMILFGSNPTYSDLTQYQWSLFVGFTFLLNVMNLNLLISIIGATFDKVQQS